MYAIVVHTAAAREFDGTVYVRVRGVCATLFKRFVPVNVCFFVFGERQTLARAQGSNTFVCGS